MKKSSILRMTKEIPNDRVNAYNAIGWSIVLMQSPHPGHTFMFKNVETKQGRDEEARHEFKPIYLVQRAQIRRPYNDHTKDGIRGATKLDYMGSAEFEFGALPRSLRFAQAQKQLYNRFKEESIYRFREDGSQQPLLIYANFDTIEQYYQYVVWLGQAIDGNLRMKESLRMKIGSTSPEEYDPDFWWDIDNHVFMSFDKEFMKRLPQHLENSFALMG